MQFLVIAACIVGALAKDLHHGPLPELAAKQWIKVGEASDMDSAPMIVNGHNAGHGNHPWQASMQVLYLGSWYHICGGSLVYTDAVLTAAHCIDGMTSYPMRVVLGDHDLSRSDGTEQYINVRLAYMHRQYHGNQQGFPNDIGYLFLQTHATLNHFVDLIPTAVSAHGSLAGEKNCHITGWGQMDGSNSNSAASVLQYSSKEIITNTACASAWGATSIKDFHVCIFNPQTSACMGDSGGPLVCHIGSENVLVGVTSWGSSTCRLDLPNVYTRLSSFDAWIRATHEQNAI